VLFAGAEHGEGTAAAQVLAKELGRDVYQVDLNKIVSKYIGETEKNLRQVFATAATHHAILFFDESDALFGKRTEVKDSHDRYANQEINYLLQQIETYDGITIIAVKRKESIDPAFQRRLRFIIEFPPPSTGAQEDHDARLHPGGGFLPSHIQGHAGSSRPSPYCLTLVYFNCLRISWLGN